jgi:hypothetical protein
MMKTIYKITSLLLFTLYLSACGGSNSVQDEHNKGEDVNNTSTTNASIEIDPIKEELCNNFPKDLLMQYYLDGKKLEIEPIDNGSGGILHCNLKLFYGEKEHEYLQGQIAASINKMADPFRQYNPERNPAIYHDVPNLGEKAVYIANMYQLQILKNGVLYAITPPANGNTTTSGKEIKEIAIEIAQHFKL